MKSNFFTLSAVAAGLIAASASPALLANDASSELERISVTGSYIKRTQSEDATPLQIIGASDISASGEITLTDSLRDIDKVSSKTMESQKQPGLYFTGEVLDVTGWLGGFNFQ